MAFSDDEDIDAPWFRDSNGKNIICVLATTFDFSSLYKTPASITLHESTTSMQPHASTSSATANPLSAHSTDKDLLIDYFEISRDLIGTIRQGLRTNWKKYQATITALEHGLALHASGQWPSHFPRFSQEMIMELVIGRSHWHSSYRFMEAVAENHPDMVAWLEMEHSTPEQDTKVWGFRVPVSKLGWPDLERYLRKHGTYPPSRSQKTQPVASSSRHQLSHHHQSPSLQRQSTSSHRYRSPSPRHYSRCQNLPAHSHSMQQDSRSHSRHRKSPSPSQSRERYSKSSYKGKEPMRR
ncbi:hypothetical protein CPB84DRAFT_1753663 [Gymnopilus junonius]|uniref:Uncharacterized protein n=1 Tax=Gymnopilus junonius TaxID=109634 RepID=A0A9P5N7U2_GYMJU|nr:hypothetical protein CPB84DRAFT_1753663 [Gymnopilus junonius]